MNEALTRAMDEVHEIRDTLIGTAIVRSMRLTDPDQLDEIVSYYMRDPNFVAHLDKMIEAFTSQEVAEARAKLTKRLINDVE